MADLLTNLYHLRDDLLREYMLAREGLEKAKVLSRIMDVDEQIEEEKVRLQVPV